MYKAGKVPAKKSPFRSSARSPGDTSRRVLLDDSDLVFCGLFCKGRDGSVGTPEYELDLEPERLFCDILGSSVGVSE